MANGIEGTVPHSLSPPQKRSLESSIPVSYNIHRKMDAEVQGTNCGSIEMLHSAFPLQMICCSDGSL